MAPDWTERGSDGDAPPLRIVIADDEGDLRLMVRLQLEQLAGFDVVGEASDGSQAVEAVVEHRPHVVVVDLLMPRVSGYEAIAALQQDQADVGIVAYSAVAGEFAKAEMDRMGVELVVKSGDVGPLADAIRRAAARL